MGSLSPPRLDLEGDLGDNEASSSIGLVCPLKCLESGFDERGCTVAHCADTSDPTVAETDGENASLGMVIRLGAAHRNSPELCQARCKDLCLLQSRLTRSSEAKAPLCWAFSLQVKSNSK